MSLLKAGQGRAILVDYGTSESPTAKVFQVDVEFDVLVLPEGMTGEQYDALTVKPENLETEKMVKHMNFSGGAKEITIDTLIKMGFDPQRHSIAALEDGPLSGALNTAKIYAVSLKESTYHKDGRLEISSIWVPGEGGGMGARLTGGASAAFVQSLGLDGEILKRMQTSGKGGPVSTTNAATPAPASPKPAPAGAKPRF